MPLEVGQTIPLRRWWEAGSLSQYERRECVLATVSRAWELCGPFDVIAGFSEGGAVAHLVADAAMNRAEFHNSSGDHTVASFASLKAAIFFSAFSPDGMPSAPFFLPSLHVFSTIDTAVIAARSIALADMYANSLRHCHADGHCVPSRAKDKHALHSFLSTVCHESLRGSLVTNRHFSDAALDIPSAQEEEQAALESIFASDYTRISTNPVQCQIAIGWFKLPSAAPTDLVPWIFLLFTLNAHYLRDPRCAPAVRLCTKERNMISMEHERSVLDAANQAMSSCAGEPSIFAAICAARDWIDSVLPNGPTFATVHSTSERFPFSDGNQVSVQSWWEVEDLDMAEVLSAGAAAGSITFSQTASGKEVSASSFSHEWKLIVGLVGKPSSGKSTFFNAACRPSNLESAARMAAHPFTTLDPNIGQAFVALSCPCIRARLSHCCSPLHGHAELPGTRRVPVVVKDVAGLVPGAYQGRGRGNAFLNDLVNCDVLVHVIDGSGKTTPSGVEGEGDPRHDIDWVVRFFCCFCLLPSSLTSVYSFSSHHFLSHFLTSVLCVFSCILESRVARLGFHQHSVEMVWASPACFICFPLCFRQKFFAF
jgi:hypothetical protein